MQSERILDLCAKYGTDTVIAAFDRLIEATEARLRSRLRSLPDGVWRHVGFCEHDGVEDRVYAVRCTMTKRGDSLEFDFTESSDQAPALINTAEPTLSGYAMTAVMTVLGYDLPWVPAAFWRVMTIKSRPGSVVHCTMPAGMSMGVTSAGQEVRTAVNICVSRLLDASDDPAHGAQILASCTVGVGDVVHRGHARGRSSVRHHDPRRRGVGHGRPHVGRRARLRRVHLVAVGLGGQRRSERASFPVAVSVAARAP